MKVVIPMESEISAFYLFNGFSFSNQTTSGYELSELRREGSGASYKGCSEGNIYFMILASSVISGHQ